MFHRKPQIPLYPLAVIAALALSVLVTLGSLAEAVSRMESFL
jgi:hypothetical protein